MRLAERIASGELAPGSPVPAERSLSEFGVARTSVREALQGLVSLGVVERRGNRMYVAEHLPEVVFASPADFADCASSSSCSCSRPAACSSCRSSSWRASGRQPRSARRSAAARRSSGSGCRSTSSAVLDRRFHTLIANACANPLLVEMYGKVLGALFRQRRVRVLLFDEANRDRVDQLVARSIGEHPRSPRRSSNGTPVDVVDASESHLASVEQRMVQDLI